MTEPIKKIEQWMDHHWQFALWSKDNGFDYAYELNMNVAYAYKKAIEILNGGNTGIDMAETPTGYEGLKFGEYPQK